MLSTILIVVGVLFLAASAFNKNFPGINSMGAGLTLIATAVYILPLIGG